MHLPCDRPHAYLITRDRAAIAYAEADYDIGRSGGCGLATGILAIVDIVEEGFTAPVAAFASSTDIVNVSGVRERLTIVVNTDDTRTGVNYLIADDLNSIYRDGTTVPRINRTTVTNNVVSASFCCYFCRIHLFLPLSHSVKSFFFCR